MKSFNLREYLIKTLNGMALGLFGSLIIGLILKQIGDFTGLEHLITYGRVAQYMMGPAIGAAVAYSVGASPLGIFASVVAGAIGLGTLKQAETGAICCIYRGTHGVLCCGPLCS